ncbi:MAG TPA: dienelactone hydrolase family protein, partial [Desulfuromonadaceae bacterium]|nr:dienelactone hydrolase family protein [Desulfuromonadaceae bacterium]
MKRFLPLLLLAITGCTHIDTRSDFQKIIQHPTVALAPQVEDVPPANGVLLSKFSFVTWGTNRVPGILVKPEKAQGRRPVVIALHGTGGSKAAMRGLCDKLADKGFITVAIDAPYHGERAPGGKNDYPQAIVRAWHGNGEHPFFYDTVWDVERLIDYLDTRDDIDPNRIGLIGI